MIALALGVGVAPAASAAASASMPATATAASAAPLVTGALGSWGRPPDLPAWAALVIAAFLVFTSLSPGGAHAWSSWLTSDTESAMTTSRRRFLTIASFVAAFLSLGYIAFYLRGGPRIIDATAYFAQGRALAHGKLAWNVIEPTDAWRGRFFLFHDPDGLSGIFPPGYPALLALGFLIGAPMVVGPLLAAAIAVATYLLTREILLDDRRRLPFYVPDVESVARLAVVVSILSATLRYHTADTMSHGAVALADALALTAALRGRRLQDARFYVVAGLCVGYVAATRLVSCLPIGLTVLWVLVVAEPRVKALAGLVLGVAPGVAFLLYAQWRVTGSALTPTQTAYYALADGPPGCFRYGFGAGVGCLHEHGDFVRARLPHGFGAAEAAMTTLRRLRMHLADAFNSEPVFLLLLFPVVRACRSVRACRAAGLLVVLQVLAYVPFYFDGNYPGGGARFYADVLPIEHALAAYAISRLFPTIAFPRRALWTAAALLLGFAVRGAFDHEALANRDGGRPAYEPDLAREGGVDYGLLFFDDDAGFDLAYDPGLVASHGVLAVRLRHDDHDRLLYDKLGHPHAFLYKFPQAPPSIVEAWVPPPIANDTFRFESEGEWPPIAQRGWVEPIWAAGTGASNDQALALRPEPEGTSADATIELPVPRRGKFRVTPRILPRGAKANGEIVAYDAKGATAARWAWGTAAGETAARDLPSEVATFEGDVDHTAGRLVLHVEGGPIALDKVTLKEER